MCKYKPNVNVVKIFSWDYSHLKQHTFESYFSISTRSHFLHDLTKLAYNNMNKRMDICTCSFNTSCLLLFLSLLLSPSLSFDFPLELSLEESFPFFSMGSPRILVSLLFKRPELDFRFLSSSLKIFPRNNVNEICSCVLKPWNKNFQLTNNLSGKFFGAPRKKFS